MTYTDDIQADCIRGKMQAVIAAIVESMSDNDEALDKRDPEPLEYQEGFTVSMPAALSFYQSTGTGTPMLDALAQRHLDAQAVEWVEQYPQRASLPDCASSEGEHSSEAQEWETVALKDETVWARIEVIRVAGDVRFTACFTDEVNAPLGVEYRQTMSESEFLALDGAELESRVARIAEAPYCAIQAVENSGGKWCGWFGPRHPQKPCQFTVGGYDTETEAREAVARLMRAA